MCKQCEIAEGHPQTGEFNAGCLSCTARMLAHSPGYAASRDRGRMSANHFTRLTAVFGAEWQAGHEATKRWAEKLQGAKHG